MQGWKTWREGKKEERSSTFSFLGNPVRHVKLEIVHLHIIFKVISVSENTVRQLINVKHSFGAWGVGGDRKV